MTVLRVLDICSGQGGASEAFVRAGDYVVRVDNDPRFKDVPFTTIADVRTFDHSGEWDVILASPPCRLYSYVRTYNKRTGEKYRYAPDLELWKACRSIQMDHRRAWYVVENVLGAQRSWGPPDQRFGPWCFWTNLPPLKPNGPITGKSKLVWDRRSPTERRTSKWPLALSEAVRSVCVRGRG